MRSAILQTVSRGSADARQRLDDWAGAVVRQAKAHPWRSLALAVGVGYVLGGGLFSALTARLLGAGTRLALRAAVVPMLAQNIAALGQDMLHRNSRSNSGETLDAESTSRDSDSANNHSRANNKETES